MYNKKRFMEARKSLKSIAKFNGVVYDDGFVFDVEEVESLLPGNNQTPLSESRSTQNSEQNVASAIDENEIEKNYTSNLIKMAIMWSTTSFTSYLLCFMNKNLEGSIYQNNYLECISGILAIIVGSQVYQIYGKRGMFTIAWGMTLLGAVMVFLIESGIFIIPQSFVSQFPGGHNKQYESAVGFIIPKVIFIAKFGCAISFLGVYQVSFSDMTLFPSSKRPTAIGTCQIFARAITILAPEAAELKKPLPITAVCFVALIALITTQTLNGKESPHSSSSSNKMVKKKV